MRFKAIHGHNPRLKRRLKQKRAEMERLKGRLKLNLIKRGGVKKALKRLTKVKKRLKKG